jgi:hypothetical protein
MLCDSRYSAVNLLAPNCGVLFVKFYFILFSVPFRIFRALNHNNVLYFRFKILVFLFVLSRFVPFLLLSVFNFDFFCHFLFVNRFHSYFLAAFIRRYTM